MNNYIGSKFCCKPCSCDGYHISWCAFRGVGFRILIDLRAESGSCLVWYPFVENDASVCLMLRKLADGGRWDMWLLCEGEGVRKLWSVFVNSTGFSWLIDH